MAEVNEEVVVEEFRAAEWPLATAVVRWPGGGSLLVRQADVDPEVWGRVAVAWVRQSSARARQRHERREKRKYERAVERAAREWRAKGPSVRSAEVCWTATIDDPEAPERWLLDDMVVEFERRLFGA